MISTVNSECREDYPVPSTRTLAAESPRTGAAPLAPTILVVEDEIPLLDILAELLQDLGYRVLTAHDGWSALDICRLATPDLVLTDVILPRMNGAELCRAIKQADGALRDVKVVLTSASVSFAALSSPADGFIPKPFNLDDIEQLIAGLIGAA
jgi:CheY-like chemotaxis protein